MLNVNHVSCDAPGCRCHWIPILFSSFLSTPAETFFFFFSRVEKKSPAAPRVRNIHPISVWNITRCFLFFSHVACQHVFLPVSGDRKHTSVDWFFTIVCYCCFVFFCPRPLCRALGFCTSLPSATRKAKAFILHSSWS